MLQRRRRRIVGALATALLAAVVPAAPAVAADTAYACLITGEAKFADKQDPGVGMRLVGGAGLWTAEFDSVCVGFAKGALAVIGPRWRASGYYHSLACGNGKFVGRFDWIDDPKLDQWWRGKKMSVEWVAGKGMLYRHTAGNPPGLKRIEDPKGGQAKNWRVIGATNARPPTQKTGSFPTPEECTKAWGIDGVMLLESNVT